MIPALLTRTVGAPERPGDLGDGGGHLVRVRDVDADRRAPDPPRR